MNWSKNLYVFMLGALIVFSGCFGTGMSDGEDDADASGTTTVNNYYNVTTNELPVFHITGGGGYDVTEQRSTYNMTTGAEETRMYYASYQFWFSVTDIDGNITSVGLDLDLDHLIDHVFYNNASWDEFSYHKTPGIAFSNGTMANRGNGEWAETPNECFTRFNLIAIDDDGGKTLLPYTLSLDYGSSDRPAACGMDYTGWEQ